MWNDNFFILRITYFLSLLVTLKHLPVLSFEMVFITMHIFLVRLLLWHQHCIPILLNMMMVSDVLLCKIKLFWLLLWWQWWYCNFSLGTPATMSQLAKDVSTFLRWASGELISSWSLCFILKHIECHYIKH